MHHTGESTVWDAAFRERERERETGGTRRLHLRERERERDGWREKWRRGETAINRGCKDRGVWKRQTRGGQHGLTHMGISTKWLILQHPTVPAAGGISGKSACALYPQGKNLESFQTTSHFAGMWLKQDPVSHVRAVGLHHKYHVIVYFYYFWKCPNILFHYLCKTSNIIKVKLEL